MALSPVIVVSVRDQKGKVATTEVKIPTGISLPNMIEFAQDMAVLIDNITTGVIVHVGIGIKVDTSGLGLTTAPGTTADVEEKGAFQFGTALPTYTAVNIPCLSDVNVVSGSDEIDTSDTDIAAFITAMTDGLTLTDASVVQPTDSREEDIISLVFARERFRSSGKRVST